MLAKQLVSGAMDVPKALLQLGIGDATEEELDAISKKVHDVSAMDKYLSDMVSIRAELGVNTVSFCSLRQSQKKERDFGS